MTFAGRKHAPGSRARIAQSVSLAKARRKAAGTMKTAAIGIDSTRIGNEPDLELTAPEMMIVHRWLAMAMNDITQQLSTMKPPAIMSKTGKAQVATMILGTKFLRSWLDANLQQIEGALEAAGIVPDVALTDEAATDVSELN